MRRSDLGLRALGALLWVVAYGTIAHLAALRPAVPQTIGTFGLASLGFMSTSAGGALLLLGGRLFDEVEVSERWRRRDPDEIGTGDLRWSIAP